MGRSFLASEKGRYKVTATIFNQAITTGIRPDIAEVCELYFDAEEETDASIANLKDHEKVCRAMKLANYGDAFESLGMDIAAIALTLVAFVGIGVILKKVPVGKLKPFLKKLAEKLALSELMTFFGTYGDAFDVAAFIGAVCDFYEQATNARNEMQLKTAGKSFERVVETFGLVAVMGFMNAIGHKIKKTDVENEIKLLTPKRLETQVEIKFNIKSFENNPTDKAEFVRQLKNQEDGLNKLTVKEWLDNIGTWHEKGRIPEAAKVQQTAREDAFRLKLDELQNAGMSYREAKVETQKWLETQAALHNPDIRAGGNPLDVTEVGDAKINSSIGGQWGKGRAEDLEKQIRNLIKDLNADKYTTTYINVKLNY